MSQCSTAVSRTNSSSSAAAEPAIRAPPGVRLLSLRDLRELKGFKFSRQWIDQLVKAGRFPKPIRPAGGHYIAWIEAEVDAHIAACIAARDHDPA